MLKLDSQYKESFSKYKFIDLFAGLGGFRLAFESFGAKCVFSSEWDKYAQEVYKMNFNDTPNGDITEVQEKDIPEHDFLCGGFPCQAFSISGNRKGFEDTRGTLFFDIVRIVKHHKPKVLFLENVKNLIKHDAGNTLNVIKRRLDDVGYNVFYSVLNASYFGVPQKRERIYILGFRKDLKINEFSFPQQLNIPIKLKDMLLAENKVKDCFIFRNDIKIKKGISIQKDIFGNYPLKPVRVGIVNKGGQGERIYHENSHAITLSAYGGGVGAKTGLYLVNDKIRKLAPRECARAMVSQILIKYIQ